MGPTFFKCFLFSKHNVLSKVKRVQQSANTPHHYRNSPAGPMLSNEYRKTLGPFFVAYKNLPGRCLVCKHGSHMINIPKADWSSVKK